MKEVFLKHYRYPADNRPKSIVGNKKDKPWNPTNVRFEPPFWEKGGITIAIGCAFNNDVPLGKTFRVSISRCHKTDNFNRKQGRAKACGKLNSEKLSYVLNSLWVIAPDGLIDYFALSAFSDHLAGEICFREERLPGEDDLAMKVEKIDAIFITR